MARQPTANQEEMIRLARTGFGRLPCEEDQGLPDRWSRRALRRNHAFVGACFVEAAKADSTATGRYNLLRALKSLPLRLEKKMEIAQAISKFKSDGFNPSPEQLERFFNGVAALFEYVNIGENP